MRPREKLLCLGGPHDGDRLRPERADGYGRVGLEDGLVVLVHATMADRLVDADVVFGWLRRARKSYGLDEE